MSASTQFDWHDVEVFVAHPHDQHGIALLRCLRRHGCRVGHAWPAPDRLTEPADLLFCALDREAMPLLASLFNQPRPAVVGVLTGDGADPAPILSAAAPHSVLPTPFDDAAVLASMVVARANFGYQRRLLSRIGKLEETLRSMRKVERAKAILMQKRHIDESAAYELLRKQAMSKRVPIGLVASVVIDSNEVLPND